jgi:uncharacterized protein (TIGR02145 family)
MKVFLIIWISFLGLKASSQNVGIGAVKPQSKLHLNEGDIYLEEIGKGVIIKSQDGKCWRLQVTNQGVSNFTSINCPDEGLLNHGGQNYKTKLMPDGRWWMIENLNIGTMINNTTNMTNNNIIEKYCYNNNVMKCDTFGGLYLWNEMMQYVTANGAQGICPNGWHIPSNTEWSNLLTSIPTPDKGSRLSGNGILWTDGVLDQSQYFESKGFLSLPAGYYNNNLFYSQKNTTDFWTSTQSSGSNAWFLYIDFNQTGIGQQNYPKSFGFSVRCVMD